LDGEYGQCVIYDNYSHPFGSLVFQVVDNTFTENIFCYRNLTPRQRELIEEFAKEEHGEYEKRVVGASG
jgi:hypothetical protein